MNKTERSQTVREQLRERERERERERNEENLRKMLFKADM